MGVTVQRDVTGRYSVRWGNGEIRSPPAVQAAASLGKKRAPALTEVSDTASKSATVQAAASLGKKRAPARTAVSVTASKSGSTRVGTLSIEDKDFEAEFRNGIWTAKWRWTGAEPVRLQSRISEYKSTKAPGVAEKYDREIQKWISNQWLVEWKGPVKGYIPLLAVVQPTKDKVRPVMDYRELNAFVESHTGDDNTAVCAEKVRDWRQLQGELKVVDLKDAYLQIRVSRDLWQYQIVKFRGKTYALTRFGFGLTCAPRVMSVILKHVLAQDETVRRATDHYIDDIMVQEAIVSADKVREHLLAYGLVSKPPESLDGGRVLGIAIKRNGTGQLRTSRGAELPPLLTCDSMMKRE